MAFDDLKLEKGIYQDAIKEGKTFSEKLEELDPTENYKGTEHDGLDAFQRQLKRFDIATSGGNSDVVAKFYQTYESSVIFPEYLDRRVREGIEEGNILNQIVGTSTSIPAMQYTATYGDEIDEADLELLDIAEGAEFPETEIKLRDKTTKFYKRGRLLKITYEALQLMKIDVFGLHLRKIGMQIGKTQLKDAIKVLLNGDGNNNAAPSFTIGDGTIGGVAGTLTYNEIVKFWMEFKEGYDVNTVIAPKDIITATLLMSEFKDPQAGFNYQSTGKMINPLGANWLRCDVVPTGKLIGMDKRYCLEEVTVSGTLIEYDKVINRQLERAAISEIKGFNKIYKDSAMVLNLK
ncbi:phage major capsid protein [Tissierella sp.]|uniref:phage major capsid protein n=1 Tax=Tissierella sp. TaxID=41274 RepID=UPI003070FBF3